MNNILAFFNSKIQRIASLALVGFVVLLVSMITGCSSLLEEPAVTNNSAAEIQSTEQQADEAVLDDGENAVVDGGEDTAADAMGNAVVNGGEDAAINATEDVAAAPLTSFEEVAAYIRQHGELPNNFITKKEAAELGWIASEGNLHEVAPEMSIGGDRFGNREGHLPKKQGRVWYEADINYDGGHRNADRIVFSNDGLIYMTSDHYKSFTDITEESP